MNNTRRFHYTNTAAARQAGFTISASQQWCPRDAARRRHPGYARTLGGGQAGFTIVELMIATLVFSLVLIVITVGVLHFTNTYYKGVNNSATQTAAQNAIDTISQSIQFTMSGSAGTDDAPAGVFCAGSRLFLYTAGKQYTGGTPSGTNWGLYMMNNPHVADCSTSGISDFSGGTELLSRNMRLTDVSVENTDPSSNLWQISLSVAYGDADLLCKTSLNGSAGGCGQGDSANAATSDVTGSDVHCKSQVGSQFCSVAALSTVAQQRLTGN